MKAWLCALVTPFLAAPVAAGTPDPNQAFRQAVAAAEHAAKIAEIKGEPERARTLMADLARQLDAEIDHPQHPTLRTWVLQQRAAALAEEAELCAAPERLPDGRVPPLEPAELAALPPACVTLRHAIAVAEMDLAESEAGHGRPGIGLGLLETWRWQLLEARSCLPEGHADRLDPALSITQPFTDSVRKRAATRTGPPLPLDADVLAWLRVADKQLAVRADDVSVGLRAVWLLLGAGYANLPAEGTGATGAARLAAMAAAEFADGRSDEAQAEWLAWLDLVAPAQAKRERARIAERAVACKRDPLGCIGLKFQGLPGGAAMVARFHSGGCFHNHATSLRYTPDHGGKVEVEDCGEAAFPEAYTAALDAEVLAWATPRGGGCTTQESLTVTRLHGETHVATRGFHDGSCRGRPSGSNCTVRGIAAILCRYEPAERDRKLRELCQPSAAPGRGAK